MSIYKNGKLIAGGSQTLPLLSFMWADHQLNHPSWLRADTFSWQSGDVYVAVYEHLLDDFENRVGKGTDSDGWLSETIDGVTVHYVVAPDGHKICVSNNESNVQALYEKTGVAWYYILDTTNKQFKLPRTKWGFTGLRGIVGNYVAPGLPNITGTLGVVGNDSNADWVSNVTTTGAFYGIVVKSGYQAFASSTNNTYSDTRKAGFNANRSSSIYGNSDTVQPKATEMYLYFYVGNFTQTALENTAGLNAEMFNDLNAHKVTEFQAPTAENGYTWYRKYADGWVEQGGLVAVSGSGIVTVTATLPVATNDCRSFNANYMYESGDTSLVATYWQEGTTTLKIQTTQITGRTTNGYITWTQRGMAAQ